MRAILSILLIALLLFNVLGGYFMFQGMRDSIGRDMAGSFDAGQYSKNQTITIAVPFSLPYGHDQDEYQRVDGEFEYEGNVYRLVKQKYFRDTLYIECVKDARSTDVKDAVKDLVATNAGDDEGKQAAGKVNFDFSKYCIESSVKVVSHSKGLCTVVAHGYLSANYNFSQLNSLLRPPISC